MHTPTRSTLKCLRRFTTLVALALVLGLTGCSGVFSGNSTDKAAIQTLREEVSRIHTLQERVERRLGLWQAATAIFLVIAGFALVGGAALGSRARRLRDRHRKEVITPEPVQP